MQRLFRLAGNRYAWAVINRPLRLLRMMELNRSEVHAIPGHELPRHKQATLWRIQLEGVSSVWPGLL